jgi:putative glycerol-1-phosphate prenyltransferase
MSQFTTKLITCQIDQKKALAVLIDPDKNNESVSNIAQLCEQNQVDFILVGGSLLSSNNLQNTILSIKQHYSGFVYLFPGNEMMIAPEADGILFLSLLSGRNPEYLIGKHVNAAPLLIQSNLDVVPTAYILIDGGRETSVSYMSNTKPIPSDKPDIATATALAGQLLGFQCTYMDAGSGALHAIPEDVIRKVKNHTRLPLIIGGGIKNNQNALVAYNAGADLLVIGNGVEDNSNLIETISKVKHQLNTQTLSQNS